MTPDTKKLWRGYIKALKKYIVEVEKWLNAQPSGLQALDDEGSLPPPPVPPPPHN